MLYDALIAPFTEFEFMRRALAAVIALSLGGAPIGVFLMLRRMSLVGDCHGACDPAGRRDRLSDLRAQPVRDDRPAA
jgi:hypothetical protein